MDSHIRLSRALIISLLVTLALTVILQIFFGAYAFGLFLFLPLSLGFWRKRKDEGQTPRDRESITPE